MEKRSVAFKKKGYRAIKLNYYQLQRYKRKIDDDFERFPVNRRLIELEKSWIVNISHKIMPCNSGLGFVHEDRKELRRVLFKYLNSKVKKPTNKNLINNDNKVEQKEC